MYLDKILFDELEELGTELKRKAGLKNNPKNIEEMSKFILQIKKEIDNESFCGAMIGTLLYRFVTSLEVRDRQTTSRLFEDLFSALFGVKATDENTRKTPIVPTYIKELDTICEGKSWSISGDLATNRREKADVIIGSYEISLKTLKGSAYNSSGEITDKSLNKEVNVGSLSFRALFKNILPDEKLDTIGDRKKGLGSGKQLREYVFDVIVEHNAQKDFYQRLKLFMDYVYQEDLYLVLKSDYNITFYLIPNASFRETILDLYQKNEKSFESVWYRWENNNLRMDWVKLIDFMKQYEHPFYKIDILLTKAVHSVKMKTFENSVRKAIVSSIQELKEL